MVGNDYDLRKLPSLGTRGATICITGLRSLYNNNRKVLTHREAQWFLLADAFTPRKHVLDLRTLHDVLPTRAFPGH